MGARFLAVPLAVMAASGCQFDAAGTGGNGSSVTDAQPTDAATDAASPDAPAPDAPAPEPLALPLRINLNGPSVVGTDFAGAWSADVGTGGACGNASVFSNPNPIHNTVDDALFQGEVFGDPLVCVLGDGMLPPGEYDVTLLFAEIYFGPGCPGSGGGGNSRVFDIALEGTPVEVGLDIYDEAGCAASTALSSGSPLVRQFSIAISDGTLDIELDATTNNANLTAVEIAPR